MREQLHSMSVDEAQRKAGTQAHSPDVRLSALGLTGFRSFPSVGMPLGAINVLIGANGAGKSNLLAFLRMLAMMFSDRHGLERYVTQAGGASTLLRRGPKVTQVIRALLEIESPIGWFAYEFELAYADSNSLYFDKERCRHARFGKASDWFDLGAGHVEPRLTRVPDPLPSHADGEFSTLLLGMEVYHFQDTSRNAAIKQSAPETDSQRLRGDAANLAPVLLLLRRSYPAHYQRILATLRQVAPFFGDFVLDPEGGYVLLRWREAGSDMVFGPHQLSDGTIRVVALLTLLLQPPELMPGLVVIDEPELGLHPAAVKIIAGLVRAASVQRQCIVATQSPQFLDEFDAGEVVVADRDEAGTHLRRLSPEALAQWLHEYSLSDLWSMNILGGRPGSVAGP